MNTVEHRGVNNVREKFFFRERENLRGGLWADYTASCNVMYSNKGKSSTLSPLFLRLQSVFNFIARCRRVLVYYPYENTFVYR